MVEEGEPREGKFKGILNEGHGNRTQKENTEGMILRVSSHLFCNLTLHDIKQSHCLRHRIKKK